MDNITLSEIADSLGISVSSLRCQIIKRDDFPNPCGVIFVRNAKTRVYNKQEVDKYLKSKPLRTRKDIMSNGGLWDFELRSMTYVNTPFNQMAYNFLKQPRVNK